MQIEFLPIAKTELDDAIAYYELQLKGLGERFKSDVQSAFSLIKKFPYAWGKTTIDNTYRYLLHKFPYALYYLIDDDKIIVLAIAHQHRKPNFWIERVDNAL